MCAYTTLPMIGIGCGIDTDHFARSGVIGNGARLIWGIPASLATLDTAMVGGVVDEPMMISALDSVTKRRAADLLRHEFKRVTLGDAERGGGSGRRDGDADGDFIGLRQRGQPRQSERRRDDGGGQIKLLH